MMKDERSTARRLRPAVLRRTPDHRALPRSAGVPAHRDLREPRLPGPNHFFFDIGHGNLLAFFDLPGLDLGPYAEVLGGLHPLVISVTQEKWDHLRGNLAAAGVE